MKSTFLKGFLATAVIALLAGYGISKGMNNSEAELEGTALANLEALANGESGGGYIPCQRDGYACVYWTKLYDGSPVMIITYGLEKCPICP